MQDKPIDLTGYTIAADDVVLDIKTGYILTDTVAMQLDYPEGIDYTAIRNKVLILSSPTGKTYSFSIEVNIAFFRANWQGQVQITVEPNYIDDLFNTMKEEKMQDKCQMCPECKTPLRPYDIAKGSTICAMCNPQTSIGLFYHSADNDGKFGGFLAKKKYPQGELVPINYGYKDLGKLLTFDVIILVDMTLDLAILEALIIQDKVIRVYDHHISRYEDYKRMADTYVNVEYYFNNEACGSEIFRHYNGMAPSKLGELIDKYDRFDFDFDNPAAPEYVVQYGTACYNLDVTTAIGFANMESLFNDIDPVYSKGTTVLLFMQQQAIRTFKNARDIFIGTHKTVAVNDGAFTKLSLQQAQYSGDAGILLTFYQTARNDWKYSIRSLDRSIDVSEIAKRYGGGGHKAAAGFTTQRLLKELL